MAKVTFNIIKDAKALEAESRALAQSLIDNDVRIQSYLLSEVAHIEEHRNPTRLNQFFTLLLRDDEGKKRNIGVRVNAMMAFVLTFANVIMPSDKNGRAMSVNQIMSDKTADGKALAFYEPSSNFFRFFSVKKDRKDALTKPAFRMVDGERIKISLWDLAQRKHWNQFKPEDNSKPVFDFGAILKRAVKSAVTAQLDKGKEKKEQRYGEVKLDESFLTDIIKVMHAHGMNTDDLADDKAVLPDGLKEALAETVNDNQVTEDDVQEIVNVKKGRAKKAA